MGYLSVGLKPDFEILVENQMDKTKSVGSKIKRLRETKMISVEDFAERSGLSVEQINLIENDNQLPSLAPLIKMARALGVRLGTFLDDHDHLGPVISILISCLLIVFSLVLICKFLVKIFALLQNNVKMGGEQ